MTGRRLRWFGATTLAIALLWLTFRAGLLGPEHLQETLHQRFGVTRIYDREGRVLQALTATAATWHRPAKLADISPHLVTATLALEDQQFWDHFGVDPLAMARAMGQNLAARRVVSGASTLTQQLCKWLAPRPRTLWGKLAEAVAATNLEAQLSKPEILELYLGYAPYGGQQRGAEQAARAWLGKSAADLTVAEAAWMAVLARSPGRLDPQRSVTAALPAQRRLLQRMHRLDWISDAQLQIALAQPIALAPDPSRYRTPHLVQWLLHTLGQPMAAQPQAVYTTVDAGLQAEVAALAKAHVHSLRDRNVGNAAVVVIDNATAQVRVLLGSTDYADAAHLGANNGALALRQPGSTIKPFTFAAAFERNFSPATLLADLPQTYDTPQGSWSPGNYGGQAHGPVRARIALASSMNLASVQILDKIGVSALLHDLARLGFGSLDRRPDHYGLALTLGDGEVSLLELTAAFATLARAGRFLAPQLMTAVVDSAGQARRMLPAVPVPVFSAATAWQLFDILADPHARELAFGRGGPLELPFSVAAKTGTSKGFRDNWAVGATVAFTVGVWVGNFDGSPMRDVSGVTGAAPLLRDVLLRLHRSGVPQRPPRPAQLEQHRLCALSGGLATAACGPTAHEWLRPDQMPGRCTWHVATDGGPRLQVPPEFRAWALSNPAIAADLSDAFSDDHSQLAILQPRPGSHYLLTPALPHTQQQLALRARVPDPQWRLRWTMDDAVLATLPADKPLLWSLAPGAHLVVVEALDRATRVVGRDSARFHVGGLSPSN